MKDMFKNSSMYCKPDLIRLYISYKANKLNIYNSLTKIVLKVVFTYVYNYYQTTYADCYNNGILWTWQNVL